jgi:hypothetical protein
MSKLLESLALFSTKRAAVTNYRMALEMPRQPSQYSAQTTGFGGGERYIVRTFSTSSCWEFIEILHTFCSLEM